MPDRPSPPRIFIDSSVLFAAAASASGASRALVLLADIGLLQFVVSSQIFEEVTRNLARKAPHALPYFEQFRRTLQWEVVADPETSQVEEAAKYIFAKDAPILAAAQMSRTDCLITLDVNHFRKPKVSDFYKGKIQTPGELLSDIRRLLTSGLALQ